MASPIVNRLVLRFRCVSCDASSLGSGTPAHRRSPLSAQEVEQQSQGFARLLLLHPMSGARDEMRAAPLGAGAVCHLLQCAGALIDTPVALAGDETGWHVDRS